MLHRIIVVLSALSFASVASAEADLDEIEWEFLRIINAYRAENGLSCLTPSPTLNAAADFMSREMGEKDFFSHEEPPCSPKRPGQPTRYDCRGRSAGQRIASFGHPSPFVGENIAAGYDSAVAAFKGWRCSPGHNENMLRRQYAAIGIGRVAVPGSAYRIYWTNTFSDTADGDFGRCGGERGLGGTVPPWDPNPTLESCPTHPDFGGNSDPGGGNSDPGGGNPDPGGDPSDPGDDGSDGGNFWGKVDGGDSDGGGCSAAGGGISALVIAALWMRRRR